MSRYDIEPTRPEAAGLEIAIGWDGPLNSFFADVIAPAGEDELEDTVLVSTGDKYGEHQDLTAILKALEPFTAVSAEMVAKLEADKLERGGDEEHPIADALRAMFRRN